MRIAVTVPEAAAMVGVSESMLWQLLARGEIAKVKIGRRTLIRISELERFLNDAEGSSVSAAVIEHGLSSSRGGSDGGRRQG